MKRLLLFTTIVFTVLICNASLWSQTEVAEYNLRPTWKAGQESKYEFWNRRDRKTTMRFNGKSRENSDRYISKGELVWIVDQVNTDGSSKCRMKYDWIEFTITSPTGEEVVVDSRKSSTGPLAPMSERLSALTSVWYTFSIAPDGTVTNVSGLNQLKAQMSNAESAPDELDFKESASDLAQLVGAPTELQVGGSWHEKFHWTNDLPLPNVKSFMNYDITYKLSSVENVEGIQLATIDGTGRMSLEVDRSTIPAEAPPIDIKMTDSNFKTQILFDLNRHEAVGRNTTQNETININISTPAGQFTREHQITHQGQVLRIAEK